MTGTFKKRERTLYDAGGVAQLSLQHALQHSVGVAAACVEGRPAEQRLCRMQGRGLLSLQPCWSSGCAVCRDEACSAYTRASPLSLHSADRGRCTHRQPRTQRARPAWAGCFDGGEPRRAAGRPGQLLPPPRRLLRSEPLPQPLPLQRRVERRHPSAACCCLPARCRSWMCAAGPAPSPGSGPGGGTRWARWAAAVLEGTRACADPAGLAPS
jgi:hypothetical protein